MSVPPPVSVTSARLVTRLTYPGDPPSADAIRDRLGLRGARYLYVTATKALAAARRDLAHPSQTPTGAPEPAVRFEELLRHLMRGRAVLSPTHQRLFLQRGIRAALADRRLAASVLHDLSVWLGALNELEARGADVTAGFPPDLEAELTSPVLGPVLTELQKACRNARPAGTPAPYEEAARTFLDAAFRPPPVVVMEGFTFLVPLQTHFVRRCLERGSRVVFVHPHDARQPAAFAILDRTHAPYAGQTHRVELATDLGAPGHDLRLLQGALFADGAAVPQGDGSVSVTAFAHRHREIAACLERVRAYLATPGADGTPPPASSVVIVTRRSSEFLTVIQEEARRLGLLDRLRIEPRLLLLTPLGRFALTLYDLGPDGSLEVSADQFETMIGSGWLGGNVQRTVETFAAARAQVFDRCRTPAEWTAAFNSLAPAPDLARLPGPGVPPADRAAWRTAFEQVAELHGRLFDGTPRSVADHIRRLREELARLNPDDLRKDEQELVERIIEALGAVVGSDAIELDSREMGDLLASVARGDRAAEDGPDPTKVWVAFPKEVDGAGRDVVFYLGVDSARVPQPAVMPWPFFDFDPDRDADHERYLFLTVVRAARKELHLSYSRRGEDEAYEPSPYLIRAARLLGREGDLRVAPAPLPATRPAAVPLPVLPGKVDALDLHDVAAFGLCPYRFRLERFDPSARWVREKFQLRFVALGVWLDRTFEGMIGKAPVRDAKVLKRELYNAAGRARAEVAELFPAFGEIGPNPAPSADWEGVRNGLKAALDDVIEWLGRAKENGNAPLDYGVSIARAPEGVEFRVEVDDRTITVRSGLRHVARVGRSLRALADALKYQHWLLPGYRGDPDESSGGAETVDGVEVFSGVRETVAWWSKAIRVALGREKFADKYRAFQQQIAARVRTIQAGRFPKHTGDHCELCPARHVCLGVPVVRPGS